MSNSMFYFAVHAHVNIFLMHLMFTRLYISEYKLKNMEVVNTVF